MKKLTDEMIEKIATYWANKISGIPDQKENAKIDGSHGDMLTILQIMSSSDSKISKEKSDLFKEELIKGIKLEEEECYLSFSDVSVDYDPGSVLYHAAKNAGISIGINTFPFKHRMSFDRETEKVYVSEGYGASEREI